MSIPVVNFRLRCPLMRTARVTGVHAMLTVRCYRLLFLLMLTSLVMHGSLALLKFAVCVTSACVRLTLLSTCASRLTPCWQLRSNRLCLFRWVRCLIITCRHLDCVLLKCPLHALSDKVSVVCPVPYARLLVGSSFLMCLNCLVTVRCRSCVLLVLRCVCLKLPLSRRRSLLLTLPTCLPMVLTRALSLLTCRRDWLTVLRDLPVPCRVDGSLVCILSVTCDYAYVVSAALFRLWLGLTGAHLWCLSVRPVHLLQWVRTLRRTVMCLTPLLTSRKPLSNWPQLLMALWVSWTDLGMLSIFRPKTLLSPEGVLVDRTPRRSSYVLVSRFTLR